jgi:hypothetical protein
VLEFQTELTLSHNLFSSPTQLLLYGQYAQPYRATSCSCKRIPGLKLTPASYSLFMSISKRQEGASWKVAANSITEVSVQRSKHFTLSSSPLCVVMVLWVWNYITLKVLVFLLDFLTCICIAISICKTQNTQISLALFQIHNKEK